MQVERARDAQVKRFEGANMSFNAAIPGGHVREYCAFSDSGFSEFKTTVERNTLSTRSMDRLAKVSRTVADLNSADEVFPTHVQKAATFVIGGMLQEGL